MTRLIAEHLLHLIIVFPIIFITIRDRKKETLKILLAFVVFFLMNAILLYLPLEFEELRIVKGAWNWTGKFLTILGAVTFLVFYKKFDLKDYFLTLNQNTTFIKKGILIVAILVSIVSILTFADGSKQAWNLESILFQLTMPGINEEIAYRGIMLGLLIKALGNFKEAIFHPAIIVTAILFGLSHALFVTHSFGLSFSAPSFFYTSFLGIIYGWITMRSGSILLALIAHNLSNVAGMLIKMR